MTRSASVLFQSSGANCQLFRCDPIAPVYGEEAFRKELLGQMAGRAGEHHYAEDRSESDEEKARSILAAELKRMHWSATDLKKRPKGDPRKVRIAARLRQETTMTLKWIAGQLHMGVGTHASNLLSRHRRGRK